MSEESSIISDAPEKAIARIQSQTDEERTQTILDNIVEFHGEAITANPKGFRGRFRKMAATPFNFYRGSATLFYHDLKVDQDKWIHEYSPASRIFIHGDLHAENFGSYMNDRGIFNFDVNDFDESYIGPFTWDLKRLLASLYLISYSKGFSNDEIKEVLRTCVDSYLKQVEEFCTGNDDSFSLNLRNTTGQVQRVLNETKIKSHVGHLDELTHIENYDRRFIRSKMVTDVDENQRQELLEAFDKYLKTIPENKKYRFANPNQTKYNVKDIVARASMGIGSAGKISYSILVEGPTESLENDVILFMKPAQKSAISHVIKDNDLGTHFADDALRTVLCCYALQAETPKWLGYTSLGSVPCLVDQATAYTESLDWKNINDIKEIVEIVMYLGKATAKIHCVADMQGLNYQTELAALPLTMIPQDTELIIKKAINGREEEFIEEMVEFGMAYGTIVRRDHQLFFEAFRNKLIPGLD